MSTLWRYRAMRSPGTPSTIPISTCSLVDEIQRQVCEDRNTLLAWGFPVRNFAYPFGFMHLRRWSRW